MTLYQVLVFSAEYLSAADDPEAAKLATLLKLAIDHIDIQVGEQRAAYLTVWFALERERDDRKRRYRDMRQTLDEKVAEIDRALTALRHLVPLDAPDKTPKQGW